MQISYRKFDAIRLVDPKLYCVSLCLQMLIYQLLTMNELRKEAKVTLKGMSIPKLKGVMKTIIIMDHLKYRFQALINSMIVVDTRRRRGGLGGRGYKCFPTEKTTERNENGKKKSENDENEADSTNEEDLLPVVGQPTMCGRVPPLELREVNRGEPSNEDSGDSNIQTLALICLNFEQPMEQIGRGTNQGEGEVFFTRD
ncbi:hypothetical protein M9H77_35556 [Catharanthus roseus]|uniref:Uncharacterized protein n=1 Tax=Catharanthus roseus TaxID=4058 RepID=A0ACB9ZPB5_CATRO|nr:hypothetical protein M9H77_35556 [Catharanthus roseus]